MAWFIIMLVVSLELGLLTPAEKVALYVEFTMPGHLWLLEAAETASAAGQLSAGGIKQLRNLVTGYGHFHPHSWQQFSPGLHWSVWMNGCAKRGTQLMCSPCASASWKYSPAQLGCLTREKLLGTQLKGLICPSVWGQGILVGQAWGSSN